VRAAACAIVLVCGLSAVEPTILPTVEREPATTQCGWIGVGVRPMTTPFAQSLGMAAPYGAIFARPEPGSPAAAAGIQEGDVVTAVNGMAVGQVGDFAKAISELAPGALVDLTMFRNGELMELRLMLGSSKCTSERQGRRPDATMAQPIIVIAAQRNDRSDGLVRDRGPVGADKGHLHQMLMVVVPDILGIPALDHVVMRLDDFSVDGQLVRPAVDDGDRRH
jgi:hypothetical protein